MTGRTYEQAMTRKVLFAAGGLLLSLLLLVVVPAAVGAALPTGAPLIVAVLLAAALFFLPDLEARSEATRRRAEFRHALGAYLDLVALGDGRPGRTRGGAAGGGEGRHRLAARVDPGHPVPGHPRRAGPVGRAG